MVTPLQLLVIEDVESDFLLAVRVLTRHGYAVRATRVDTLAALDAALAGDGPDLVISDYNLPGLGFEASFERVRAKPGLPLILLSGSVGEERAVELLKSGVADFVLKSNLGRLAPAVDRCLRERAESRARAEAESALAQSRAQLETLVATRTEELRQRERDLQAILDNVPALIGYWDRSQHNRFANQAYHDWLGLPAGSMHGRLKRDVLGPQRYARVQAAFETALGGEPSLLECEFPPVDGSCRYVQTHYIPDRRDGEVHGVYVLVGDVTELKRAEQAAEAARREAERLARAKAEFLANMSHEIRTPLNAVLGFAELGLEQSSGRRVNDTLQRILDAGTLLLGIVDDILDYSKIEAGKLTLEDAPFAPGAVVDRVIDVIGGRARERGLELRVDETPDLPARSRGDALRLAQVLLNLLSNAVKFTATGGRVTLGVRHGADGFVFEVTDTGIGMDPELVARLFQPFEQADGSITRRFGGTGLGLAISARLVERMGGRIDVDSRPGFGSRFEVCVPLPVLPAAQSRLPAGSVAIHGLAPAETSALAAALAAHGVRALPLAADAMLPVAAMALVSGCGSDDGRCRDARSSGRRLLLVTDPVARHELPPPPGGAVCIERPLRPRQVLAALAQPLPPAGAPVVATRRARLEGRQLLVIEDNEVNRLLLEAVLEREGARLTLVENGRHALEWLQAMGAAHFDLVLTDLQMPEMDGYETARRILASAPDLPVLALSAHALPAERERCLAIGMKDQLTRPVSADALVAAVLRHCRPSPAGARVPACAAAGVDPDAQAGEPLAETGAAPSPDAALDWAAVEADFPGRPEFLRRLVDTVFTSNAEVPARLAQARADADLAALAFLAHGLKGMGGTLHAEPLRQLATRVETLARQGDASAWTLQAALEAALASVLAALRVLRPQL